MRAVVQRVTYSNVKVDGNIVGEINRGFNVLIGISKEDTEEDMKYIKDKLINLRVFEDENNKMNLSLSDIQGELLIISQFTLYGDVRKGRRPSFVNALAPQKAIVLYDRWLSLLREIYPNAQSGVFGADMKVSLVNDGPFTLILDSDELRRKNA